jgi:hypothetical protein
MAKVLAISLPFQRTSVRGFVRRCIRRNPAATSFIPIPQLRQQFLTGLARKQLPYPPMTLMALLAVIIIAGHLLLSYPPPEQIRPPQGVPGTTYNGTRRHLIRPAITQAVCFAADRSAETGQPISISEFKELL